jgi:hypothetical protein
MRPAHVFEFVLCVATGAAIHPDYLPHHLTARQYAEWVAVQRIIGPIGPVRDDFHAALGAWTSARTNGATTAKLADFMPNWSRRGAKTEAEIRARFAASAANNRT